MPSHRKLQNTSFISWKNRHCATLRWQKVSPRIQNTSYKLDILPLKNYAFGEKNWCFRTHHLNKIIENYDEMSPKMYFKKN